MNKNNKPNEPIATNLEVAEKLTYHNYITWCRMMHIEIKSRGILIQIYPINNGIKEILTLLPGLWQISTRVLLINFLSTLLLETSGKESKTC